MVYETQSAQETFALGERIGREAGPGQIYTLTGDLGVGKTVLTQGVAKGLGITGPVSSPTFTIVQVYENGRLPFYHFDVYRIGDVEEMEEVGYEDCFYGGGVCLIEWAELISELLPSDCIHICIEKISTGDLITEKLRLNLWGINTFPQNDDINRSRGKQAIAYENIGIGQFGAHSFCCCPGRG